MQTVGLERIRFRLWKISVACACGWAFHSCLPPQGSSTVRALTVRNLGSSNGPRDLPAPPVSAQPGPGVLQLRQATEGAGPAAPHPRPPFLEAPPPPPSVLRLEPLTCPAKWRDTGSPASSMSPRAPGKGTVGRELRTDPPPPEALDWLPLASEGCEDWLASPDLPCIPHPLQTSSKALGPGWGLPLLCLHSLAISPHLYADGCVQLQTLPSGHALQLSGAPSSPTPAPPQAPPHPGDSRSLLSFRL